MASVNVRGGLAHLSINGKSLLAKGTFEIDLGTPKYTPIFAANMQGAVGFKSEPKSGKIKGEILLTKDTDVMEIVTLQNGSCVVQSSDGVTYAINDGFFTEDGVVSLEENSLKFAIEGPQVQIIK